MACSATAHGLHFLRDEIDFHLESIAFGHFAQVVETIIFIIIDKIYDWAYLGLWMLVDISACGNVPCWVYSNENVSGDY